MIENQNSVANNNNNKGETYMTNERIAQIKKDIADYKQAIEDAEGALAQAERELDEIYGSMNPNE